MHRAAVYWLRRDLRLADNPALLYACEHAESVVLAYIHAPEEEAPWPPGAASRWWLHRSLESLTQSLAKRGQTLTLRIGTTLPSLRSLVHETNATLVVWNRVFEPAFVARDTKIKFELQQAGLDVQSFNATLLFEPWQIKTQQAAPYRVFTPFWRTCASKLDQQSPPQAPPKSWRPQKQPVRSERLSSLNLLPQVRWDAGLSNAWQPGELGALRQRKNFAENICPAYPTARDRPAADGTSRLSPHFHFGEIGPRQILASLNAGSTGRSAPFAVGREQIVRQLGWREFAHHVLFHYPHTAIKPFDDRFEDFRWQKSPALLRAWQRGQTGFPIVDAGMRELWQTGYMHNRVRMLAASLLTKNLRVHWLEGAKWFWDTLVDADLANNSLGWQWTAGCGTDAAPYFRVFNPQLQSERFDAAGIYLRRWLPELAKLSNKSIHAPNLASPNELKTAGVELGRTYPRPIVDLKQSRDVALDNYKRLRKETK